MLTKLAWRNLWRNRKRSLITISSIVIAVFLAVFMRSMQLGMYDNMINNVVGSYFGYVQIHGNGFWEEQSLDNAIEVDEIFLKSVQSVDGVSNVIQRLQTFSLASSEELTKGVLIQGIEMNKEQLLTDWSTRLVSGRLLKANDNEVILAKGVAKYFKLDVGDTVVFIGQGYHGMSAAGKHAICGIVDMKNPKINNLSVFMSLPTSQDFLSSPNMITHLIIDKHEKAKLSKLTNDIQEILDPEIYEVMDWKKMLPELEQTILADSVGGLLMVFILYMIITFGIFGTVLMMTQERIYELGVMVAVGMKKAKLAWTLVLESMALTIVGIATGTILVLPLMYYFHANPIVIGDEQGEAMEKFGFEATVPLLTDFDIPLTHGGIIFIISLIISLYPIYVVMKMDPIKAMKR